MPENTAIRITRVANGFYVAPYADMTSVPYHLDNNNVHVFNTLNDLFAFLATHFPNRVEGLGRTEDTSDAI